MSNGAKVAFSLGGSSKKKKKSSSSKTVSAQEFGHREKDNTEEAEEIRSFDAEENRRKEESKKAPLVIPLTQPANTLVDRIKQVGGKRQQQQNTGAVKSEDPSSEPKNGDSVKEETQQQQSATDSTDIKDEEVLEAVLSSSSRNKNGERTAATADGPVISASDNATSAMRQTASGHNTSIKDHLDRELEELPDEADEEAYEKIPIEQFGAALLRGMGWNESAERKQEESNQMMGSIPRPSRLGLGAIPKAPGGGIGALDMPSVLSGKNSRNKKKKLTEHQLRQQEEFEKQRELQKKQDKQQTRQIGSIVYLLEEDHNNNNANNNSRQKRAKIVQLMGVPGLNMVLVHLERQPEPTPVKKGLLGPLVPRSDLEDAPFALPKPRKSDNQRDGERDKRRRDRSRSPDEGRRRRERSRSADRYDDDDDDNRKSDRRRDKRERHDRDRGRSRSPDRYRDRDDRKSDRKRDRRDRDRDERDRSRSRSPERKSDRKRDKRDRDDHRDRRRRDRDRDGDDDRRRRDKDNNEKRSRRGNDSGSDDDGDRDKRKRKESRSSRDERDRKRSKSDHGNSNNNGSSKRDNSDGPMWIIPNIRVRVVTEKLGKRHFRQKGVIVDVTRKHGATLRMDMLEGGKDAVLEHVPERYIETALPKAGGNVIVLTGEHKWTKGKLLERNSKTAKGSLQVFEDMSILTLSLDDMAEWCGPLDGDLG